VACARADMTLCISLFAAKISGVFLPADTAHGIKKWKLQAWFITNEL